MNGQLAQSASPGPAHSLTQVSGRDGAGGAQISQRELGWVQRRQASAAPGDGQGGRPLGLVCDHSAGLLEWRVERGP